MAVYVDNMRAKFGRMTMCHMLADTDEELHNMAQRIGVARKWHQYPNTVKSHYDICLTKRALAVQYGAVEIDLRDTARIVRDRRIEQSNRLRTEETREQSAPNRQRSMHGVPT